MLEQVDLKAKKMTKEEYKPIHDELIGKLVLLQQQARSEGVGLVVLVEGWCGAGKGSRISDLVYELDARATRVYELQDIDPKAAKKFPGLKNGVQGKDPLMREFWQALGERTEITFYDRGWYTAAAEKALFGLIADDPKKAKELKKKVKKLPESERAAILTRSALASDVIGAYQDVALNFEKLLVNDGYAVVKLFVHVSKKAQKKRLEAMRANPDTAWRVSDQKLAMTKYYDEAYEIFDRFLEESNFAEAPWTVVNGEDRRAANIQFARAIVDALEHALAAKAEAAKEATDEAKEPESEEERIKFFEEKADAQSALAPHGSKYPIVADCPQIDHTVEKPRIETREEYSELLKVEQARFRKLQEEALRKRIPIMIMYEGWDAAGKGGNIKRIAQALDARTYRIFTSPSPKPYEKAHPHLWRYWTRMPEAGKVGIYDRSWYGRVLVERIEGYAKAEEWQRAYDELNDFEHELTQWGVVLLKFWVDITPDEQLTRFEARAADPSKSWKLTDEDWRNREKYSLYKAAADDMFRLTSTTFAPWTVLQSDSKWYARIQALRTINEALEARLNK